MSATFDCSDPDQRASGLASAISAAKGGRLVVMPTDTVYGIGADAFDNAAVGALLAAKNRGRDMPVGRFQFRHARSQPSLQAAYVTI